MAGRAACSRLLAAILRTALEDELLARTPCTLRGAGQEHSPERPLLSMAQALALADAVGPRTGATSTSPCGS